MFRTQQNNFDDAVAKATDENLTSENWEYILDVCDKVSSSDSGAKDVVAAMIKRLAHRNANVQLYTLELANALSQNCGVTMHRELASRSFTDAILRLANDRNTHQQVKSKILERMEAWTKDFSSNTELGIMEQAYMRLKAQNPNLQPPQAPVKRQITEYDRQKEEEELQMALRLSIQDKTVPAPSSSSQPPGPAAELSAQPSSTGQTSTPHPVPSGTTAATVSRVRALYDFQPSEAGELQFRKGDVIAVLESVYKDWWKGSLRGQTGIFPLNYVEKLQDPTPEELQKEAHMEAEVFGQIKNVEKLLALLSTSTGDTNVRDNEEITELYHSTLSIRPKLIELIGKYSQKKDDFQQLNEKFIKARRDYEALLESSMAHSAANAYARPSAAAYGYGGGGPHAAYPDRFYTPDGQPPNNAVPLSQSRQSFHPPYPISSPPPPPQGQLSTSQQHPSQPPHEAYSSYPPQMAAGRQHSQSDPHAVYPPPDMATTYAPAPSGSDRPDSRPGAPQYPTTHPGPAAHLHYPDDGKDYSPSNYSTDDLHHAANVPPLQQQQQTYPPQPQSIAPGYPSGPSSSNVQQYDYQASVPSQIPSNVPGSAALGPGGHGADKPPTPLPQSSAYPVFTPGPAPAHSHQQYQAYSAPPPNVPGAAPAPEIGAGARTSYYR